MTRTFLTLVAAAALATLQAGCEAAKSANPISPTAVELAATPVVPPPPVVTSPSPSPSPTVWPRTGDELVTWATQRYPDYLVNGVSAGERQGNMAFVRDRMIEAGICGGMDLAWNMKRGGPERSTDYLAYRTGGRWIGVDIGLAYDDTSIALRLHWGENPGDTQVSPAAYSPRPDCG